MAPKLTPLGHARVFRHPGTGELVVDTDSLRRSSFSGEFGDDDFDGDDFEGDDFGDDDFGDDDFEGDDDLGDDDFEGDDDFGDDDEIGRGGWLRRRRARRKARRQARRSRRKARRQARRHPAQHGGKKKMKWGMTAVGGTDTVSEAGAAAVKIRLQHDFRAQDVTFTGSTSGSLVTSVFFGDRVVWSNSDGIDTSVFATNSFMRGLLKGQSLRAGLDITVNGTMPGAGTFSVTIIGQKPVSH